MNWQLARTVLTKPHYKYPYNYSRLNCIIIDDEPLAIKVIEKHLSMIDGFGVSATFDSALPVYKYLQSNEVDLVFLDIELPNLTGLNFLGSLSYHPEVILTTAHREYALESYDHAIVDYLLKPISFERFLKAISKLKNAPAQQTNVHTMHEALDNKEAGYTFIKVDRRNIRINFNEILYIESLKNHVKLVMTKTNHITHMNLQEIEGKLDKKKFARVHKSFIVAVDHIESFNQSNIQTRDHLIPIGRSYKLKTMEILNGKLI